MTTRGLIDDPKAGPIPALHPGDGAGGPLPRDPTEARRGHGRALLRSRSYVIFMAGSILSWVGDWMDLAALNWAALEMTGSALGLASINACRLIPVFALSLPSGLLADRFDRRRLLIVLTAITMASTFLVAALVAARVPFWAFAAAVAARSAITAMVPPVRNALLPNLVPLASMPSAVAGQAALMNLSRIAGPAIAGVLLATMPLEDVFWVNALSFLGVIASLLLIRVVPGTPAATGRRRPGAAREAFGFIRSSPAMQSLLILAIVPMVFGFPYTALLPLFARERLGLGPEGFGLLLSVTGLGALIGSTWLTIRGPVTREGVRLVLSVLGFGLALLGFTAARSFEVAAVALFAAGFASQVYRTAGRIALHGRVPDHLRGRILSIALMDRGLIPLGTVLLGFIAEYAGVFWAGIVMGGGCILATLLLLATRLPVWRL